MIKKNMGAFMSDDKLLSHIGYGMRLNVELGNMLYLDIQETEEIYSSVLIGLEPLEYLIVRPQFSQDIHCLLSVGQKISIRYQALGNEYGFKTHIIAITDEPCRLIFLSYPRTVESIEIRKEKRVGCYIPATVNMANRKIKGVISDISTSGCRFIVKLPEHLQPRQLQLVDTVVLLFPFIGLDGVQEFAGRVRNTTIDRKRISMGLEFVGIKDDIIHRIDDYILKLGEL
jgi:c-di-GMP-binding flagellar brake protein YcgR